MARERGAVVTHDLGGRRRDRDPLRIAVIGPSLHPVSQPFAGGLEAMVWHLVHGLRRRGHRVTLFAAEGSDTGDGGPFVPLSRWEPSAAACADVSMPEPVFMRDHHSYLSLLLALSGRLADRFDVVHNHSLHYLPVAMAPSLPQPVLTSLHTPPTPWLESAVLTAAAAGLADRLGGGDDPGTSAFVAVSEAVADQWVLPGGRAEVVHNGVDPHVWAAGPGGPDLVWSGRIVPEKAPHLAIDAARRAGRRLVLAGPIHDRAYFEALVRPALGPDVEHAGHLGSADLAQLVGEAGAALVTPVWDEPYGLVVAEALACGTPVVAFRRGGIPEIVSSPRLGALVTPGDTVAMAAAVDRAVTLDREHIRLHAVRHLSWTGMVTAYERRYHRLLSDAIVEASLPA